MGRKDRSRNRKRIESWQEVKRLARFLAGFVRPHWKLVVAAVAVTALNALANASRAGFAGAFTKYVLDAGEPVAAPKQAGPVAVWLAETFPRMVAWWAGLKAEIFAHLPPIGDAWGWLKVLAGGLAAVAVTLALTEYGKDRLAQTLVIRVIRRMREVVCEHLLSLSLRFFHGRRIGDLYSRLTNDIHQAQNTLTFLFVDLSEHIFRLAAGVLVCVVVSWRLSLAALVAVPVVIVPLQVLSRKIRKNAKGRQIEAAEVTEAMQQMLTGVRIVKAFDAEKHEIARFHDRNEAYIRKALRVIRAKAATKGMLELVNHAVVIALLVVGSWFVFERRMIAKDELVTFMVSLGLMYEPAKRFVKAYNNMQDALAGVERVEEVLALRNDVADAPGAKPLAVRGGAVAVRRVSFKYGTEPVLADVTVEARPGEVVALVGPSGAGKSTLIDLIARFYDPDAGTVEIDGQDIRQVTRSSLARELAIVTQDPFLFNDTIFENVRYGRRGATRAEVEAACRAANIHDAIAALPEGYDAVVGERGAKLSGGQRQRLTIARALLKDPKILLLDEATSALDSESEKAVQTALERLMKGRTTIVVAHRLSTVIGADRIYVLDRGRVVEEGRHEDLVRQGGLYAKLWRLQSGAGAPEAAAVV